MAGGRAATAAAATARRGRLASRARACVILYAAAALGVALPAWAWERETVISARWCEEHAGQAEATLYGGGRADCLTATHAVEVERAARWTEGLGQALWYSVLADRRAGLVLIVDDDAEWRYWVRLGTVVEQRSLPVDLWLIDRRESAERP